MIAGLLLGDGHVRQAAACLPPRPDLLLAPPKASKHIYIYIYMYISIIIIITIIITIITIITIIIIIIIIIIIVIISSSRRFATPGAPTLATPPTRV